MKPWFPPFLLLACSTPAAASLALDDFAYGLRLTPVEQAPIYALELPEAVYLGVVRPDLGDIRVFNAAGNQVPHDLNRPLPEQTEPTTVALPFFPLDPATGEPPTAIPSLRLSRDTVKTIVELDLGDPIATRRSQKVYLLDARGLERPIQGLRLDWDTTPDDLLVTARVDASGDLREWRSLVTDAGIADLAFADHHLQRRHIEMPPVQADYFRLTLTGHRNPPPLTRITAERVRETVEPPWRWASVTLSPDPEKAGHYRFEAPESIPFHRLRIELPQDNTLVEASLYSRSDPQAGWSPRGQGLLYRLQIGDTVLENNTFPVQSSGTRHWSLIIDAAQSGLGREPPRVAIGWHPHTLLFVARGAAPFTLAYGSGRAEPMAGKTDALLRRLDRDTTQTLVSRAITVAQPLTLGGEKALQPVATPIDWKQVILWGTLIGGVVLLGWMAHRLLREIKT